MAHRLAIDVGSSGVKVYAGGLADAELHFEQIARMDNGTRWQDGRHVWDVETLTDQLREEIERAADGYDTVASVGIDATALDFGLLADGELLRNPYFYRDPSLWTATDAVTDRCSARESFHLTGYNGPPGPLYYQLQEAPDTFVDADTLVPLPGLLSHQLGGEAATETSYAMTLRLLDIRTRDWADDLIKAIEFPRDLLQDPVAPGTTVGSVTGVAGEPDIVLPASHDTASAVGALPLTAENNVFLCTGSWFIPGLELPEPTVTDEAFDAGGSNEVGVEGTVRFMRNLPGFSLLEHCRDRWRETDAPHEYELLLKRVAELPVDGPIVDIRDDIFVEAQFEGDVAERVRDYCKRTDQEPPEDEFEMTRCLLVSLAVGSAIVIDQLTDLANETVDRVHLGGGGVRNELFCSMFASAVGKPVKAGPTEATALGNILYQLRSGGEIPDFETGRQLVTDRFSLTTYEPQNESTWAALRERVRILDR
ncbi:carbohydrate kinase [Halobellus salinus]|uniref:Carbohydrate kinase n=1 Tax=Halobellus salinus TaxID=931585 RepID=A0A830EDK3_9EURY|nr:FGGY-family carbohydrate kinase [Halobellus salinus]GGJ01669.1 carbohydrate kinase [Halobellus salinus]SMP18334.1 rhamnulokinase [Halobellus salinus]